MVLRSMDVATQGELTGDVVLIVHAISLYSHKNHSVYCTTAVSQPVNSVQEFPLYIPSTAGYDGHEVG